MHCTCILRQFSFTLYVLYPNVSPAPHLLFLLYVYCTLLTTIITIIRIISLTIQRRLETRNGYFHLALKFPHICLPSLCDRKKNPFHPQPHISSAVLFSIPSINILPYNLSSAVTRSSYSY